VIEGGGTALVIMETVLRYPDDQGKTRETTRRATYVFRQESDNRWRCTVDNSYGTSLLQGDAD
jgi:ketosteroid isomerase-like protein